MRELYILAVGIAVGLSVGELLESYQRRIAYRAADIAEETLERRMAFRRRSPLEEPVDAPAAPAPGPEQVPA